MKQLSHLDSQTDRSVSIAEAATLIGVSQATIRNWIKTQQLAETKKNRISKESISHFIENKIGKNKLISRANKSKKNTTSCKENNHFNFDKDVSSLSNAYENSLSDAFKNMHGVYYTPEEVIDSFFEFIGSDNIDGKIFCDPCCGSGNFIIKAIRAGFSLENIYAFDIDEVALEITRKRALAEAGQELPHIYNIDFLSRNDGAPDIKFDYIFTNPPWGKKTLKAEREAYFKFYKQGVCNDSCSAFVYASIQLLNEGGKLAFLLPEAFFNVASFERIRQEVLKYKIDRIVDYGKVFKGLMTKAQGLFVQKICGNKKDEIACVCKDSYKRKNGAFKKNPKSIFNFYCSSKDAEVISYLLNAKHMTIKGHAQWGLGIVTGDNKRFILKESRDDYIPVLRGSDITSTGIKKASLFIPKDMSRYQQVASSKIYDAQEKIIYKFITSKLCFAYDNRQRYVLNSANILIVDKDFPVSMEILAQVLSCKFTNWLFYKIFNTNKILRSDIESIPIFTDALSSMACFDESKYIDAIGLSCLDCGSYVIKGQEGEGLGDS